MNGTRAPNRESRVTRSCSLSPPKLSTVKTESHSPMNYDCLENMLSLQLENSLVKTAIKSSPKTIKSSPKKLSIHSFRRNEKSLTSLKTVHKSLKKAAKKFILGQEILTRWKDGLFYLGTILKVDKKSTRCYVQFEDKSEFWILFKDIQRGRNSGEIICCLCQGGKSDVPNEIVLCDNCGMGYHQNCHNPVIHSEILIPEVNWCCRLCVFASTVKKGGALKQGPNAQALQVMKQSFPYELKKLTWDAHHKTNVEQCYCYCGGPGDWYMKMLQCCRCRQWFHEACIQCLDQPFLYGDRFYIFVCSHCNSGPEFIKRLQLKWVDVVHLVLFNLTLQNIKKYYDLHEALMPFINKQWSQFQTVEIVKNRCDTFQQVFINSQLAENESSEDVLKQRESKVLEALQNYKSRFCWGREIKRKNTLWGLQLRVPPPAPTVQLPVGGQITDEVMNSLQMKGGKIKTFIPLQCSSPVPLCYKRKSMESGDSVSRKIKKARKLYSNATKMNGSRDKCSAHQTYKGYAGKISRIRKQHSPHTKCVLDKYIPHPANFEGLNHPFKTILECEEELAKQTMKTRLINLYHSSLDSDDTCTSQSSASSVVSSPQPADYCFGPPVLEPITKQLLRRGRKKRASLPEDPPRLTRLHPERLKNGLKRRRSVQNVVETADIESVKSREVNMDKLKSNVGTYFGAVDRLAKGEKFDVLARRITSDGTIQYLVEWKGNGS